MKYRGYHYFKDLDGLWKVLVNGSEFIVALDDSKINSNKKINEKLNNEMTCKRFIDWLKK